MDKEKTAAPPMPPRTVREAVARNEAMARNEELRIFQRRAVDLIQNVEGGVESRFDCTITVVGHFMAGKTTLIKRLLLEHFDMRTTDTTNGIINIMKAASRNEGGNWEITEIQKDSKDVHRRMKSAKAQNNPDFHGKMTSAKSQDSTDHYLDSKKIKLAQDVLEQDEHRHGSRLYATQQPNDQSDDDTFCRLKFMDFAGQSVFNSTHQTFMNNRAIYLLVLDISRPLDSEVEDDDVYCVGSNRRLSVQDFTVYLLSSIHVYSGYDKESYPKVLLIGTHRDQVDLDIGNERMGKLKEKIEGTLLTKHVRGYFIVDCSKHNDPVIAEVRQFIFEIVQKEPHWGEKTPTRWLPLEKSIIDRRERGDRVLTIQTIKQMNDTCFVNLETDDEVRRFLLFHNEIGNLMYFGGTALDDIVILDPQWLIDAFKQFITLQKFRLIPKGFESLWKDFTQSAKLDKNLIKAVWKENKDKSFDAHMKQLLTIFEQTDIISCPLIYNEEGQAEAVNYYFVPSMLKPNKDGKGFVDALLRFCMAKSPSLCFEFRDKFIQPAIFPRFQAACTAIYKIKEDEEQQLMFYQIAVFQLNHELDLVIRQEGHIIKIIIMNENGVDLDNEICRNVMFTLENALTDIVRLYGGETGHFQKAIQCKESSASTHGLLKWPQLEKMMLVDNKSVICKVHQYEKWHRVNIKDVLHPWIAFQEEAKSKRRSSARGNVHQNVDLEFHHLGRLARRLEASYLRFAARPNIGDVVTMHSAYDNPNNTQGETYNILVKWREKAGRLTLEKIYEEVNDSGKNIGIEVLKNALADTDTSKIFKHFERTFLDRRVNDKTISLVSQRCALTYRFLGLELGIPHNEIETVVQDYRGVTHRASILLNMWRTKSSTATYRELFQAIVEVDGNIKLLKDCETSVKIGI